MKTIYIIIFVPLLIVISGCKGEARIMAKVSDLYSGSGDDGITNNVKRYAGVNKATDGLTEAESFAFDINTGELSCRVHAECTDPSSNDLVSDQAVATSNNQVVREFKITKKGDLTFHVKTTIEGEKIVHGDSIQINVRANILNSDGSGYTAGGLIIGDFTIKPNANAIDKLHTKVYSYPAKGYLRPEEKGIGQNGNVEHTVPVTINGDSIAVGDYQLELSLRVSAYANAQVGNDGKKFKASVEKVKATISLN